MAHTVTPLAKGDCVTSGAIHGHPSKSFFVDMLTRDITVSDSILDLLDNSIDSAVSRSNVDVMQLLKGQAIGTPLSDYRIDLAWSRERMALTDNCGGVPVKEARERVFLMGSPKAGSTSSGLSVYGIGMKRAFFKLGNAIAFESQTDDHYFHLDIDVRAWQDKGDLDWDFDSPDTGAARDDHAAGTSIVIEQLHDDVSQHLALSATAEEFRERVSGTYALFIEAGLQVELNGRIVESALPRIGGANVTPARTEFTYNGVDVLVVAGITPKSDKVQRGTYVFCNGRMVLDTDRSRLTGWGDLLPKWHTKFGHFVGYLYFQSDDVKLLPWTTTKQGVVFESAVYQKALTELQTQARKVLNFLTRVYPGEVEEARIPEREALEHVQSIKLTELSPGNSLFNVELPEPEPEDRDVNILFKRKASDVERVQECLPHLKSAKAVGEYAFDYLLERECR